MKYYNTVVDENGRFTLQTNKLLEDIPLEDYKYYFKEYWEFIAENELDYKPCITDKNQFFVFSGCFACQYRREMLKRLSKFHPKWFYCPLKVFNHDGCELFCLDDNSIYTQWKETVDPQIALEIANLEWEDYHE